MTTAFHDLYRARVDYALATPGTTEWWDAIRRMRAAHQRIQNAIDALVSCYKRVLEGVVEFARPLLSAIESFELSL